MARRPPLDLAVEIADARGTRYRLDANGPAGARPLGITFGTKRGDGFASGGYSVVRRADRDWWDIGLLDEVFFTGADGDVAYEGRQFGAPRSIDDRGHSIALAYQGWMSHGKDRRFTENYVSRDLSAWGALPLLRKVNRMTSWDLGSFDWTNDGDGLVCSVPGNAALNVGATAEVWFIAPPGTKIAKVMYLGSEVMPGANWGTPQLFWASSDDGVTTGAGSSAATLDGALHSVTVPSALFAWWQVFCSTAYTTPNGVNRRLTSIGVFGDHTVPTRTISPTSPDGVYASDVIVDIAERFCPMLSTTGVQGTTYPIPHLVFANATFPFDAFLEVNKFHLWDLGVWEGKTLTYKPTDLTDYDWELRTDDPGVSVEFQGDEAQDLFNGICVNYTDVVTMRPARITPLEDATLLDLNPSNPANQHGYPVWDEANLSSPTTAAGAVAIARLILAEKNMPKAPGVYRVKGHIRDRQGHWQQVWKVRAGQRIVITSSTSLSDRPRLVVETNYTHDNYEVVIGIDNTLPRVDAVLDRLTTEMQARGLG